MISAMTDCDSVYSSTWVTSPGMGNSDNSMIDLFRKHYLELKVKILLCSSLVSIAVWPA